MSDQNNTSTEHLQPPALEERLTSLEKLLALLTTEIRAGFKRMDERLDELSRTQREMYVDLRERIDLLSDKVAVMQRTVDQVVRDARPDSLQNRLLN
ncbi:MAG TPA: hypothetical protein VNQ79_12300 [Blastocatellia bacterium]|nr:hypothetical protein [Blastocatellia bacterium]